MRNFFVSKNKCKALLLIIMVFALFSAFIGCESIIKDADLEIKVVQNLYDNLYVDKPFDLDEIVIKESDVTYSYTLSYFEYDLTEKFLELNDSIFTPSFASEYLLIIKAQKGEQIDEVKVTLIVSISADKQDIVLMQTMTKSEPGEQMFINTDTAFTYGESSKSSLGVIGTTARSYGFGLSYQRIKNYPAFSAKDFSNSVISMWVYSAGEYPVYLSRRIISLVDDISTTHTIDAEVKVEPKVWTKVYHSLKAEGIQHNYLLYSGSYYQEYVNSPLGDYCLYFDNIDIEEYDEEKFPDLDTRSPQEKINELGSKSDGWFNGFKFERTSYDIFTLPKVETSFDTTIKKANSEYSLKVKSYNGERQGRFALRSSESGKKNFGDLTGLGLMFDSTTFNNKRVDCHIKLYDGKNLSDNIYSNTGDTAKNGYFNKLTFPFHGAKAPNSMGGTPIDLTKVQIIYVYFYLNSTGDEVTYYIDNLNIGMPNLVPVEEQDDLINNRLLTANDISFGQANIKRADYGTLWMDDEVKTENSEWSLKYETKVKAWKHLVIELSGEGMNLDGKLLQFSFKSSTVNLGNVYFFTDVLLDGMISTANITESADGWKHYTILLNKERPNVRGVLFSFTSNVGDVLYFDNIKLIEKSKQEKNDIFNNNLTTISYNQANATLPAQGTFFREYDIKTAESDWSLKYVSKITSYKYFAFKISDEGLDITPATLKFSVKSDTDVSLRINLKSGLSDPLIIKDSFTESAGWKHYTLILADAGINTDEALSLVLVIKVEKDFAVYFDSMYLNGLVDPEDPEDPENPVDPEDPTDPQNPVDPKDPADPEDPIDPEKNDITNNDNIIIPGAHIEYALKKGTIIVDEEVKYGDSLHSVKVTPNISGWSYISFVVDEEGVDLSGKVLSLKYKLSNASSYLGGVYIYNGEPYNKANNDFRINFNIKIVFEEGWATSEIYLDDTNVNMTGVKAIFFFIYGTPDLSVNFDQITLTDA